MFWRIRRSPTVRFLIAGAGIHLLATAVPVPASRDQAAAVSADGVIERLAVAALRRGLHHDDAVIAQRLAQNRAFLDPSGTLFLAPAVDAALLQRDPVIQRRLAQRLRYLLESTADLSPPSRREIEDYLVRHPPPAGESVFVRAEIVRFAEKDSDAARSARRQLRETDSAGAMAGTLGAAPLDATEGWLSERTLAQQLGAQIAGAVVAQPVGEWSQPLHAPTGVYLVRVRERHVASESPAAADARAQSALLADRRAAAFAAGLAALSSAK